MDGIIAEHRPTFIPEFVGRFSMETVMGAHPRKAKSDQSSLELTAYCLAARRRGPISDLRPSQCMKMSKLRHHLEWICGSRDYFSNLVDECRRSVA